MPPTKEALWLWGSDWPWPRSETKSTDQVTAHHSDAEIGDVPEATPSKFDVEPEHD